MPSAERRGILRCAIAAVLFGATVPILARFAADTSAPILAGLLYLGAAGGVLPLVARRRTIARIGDGGARLAAAVVAGGMLGPLMLAAALGRVPAATASLLLNLELVFTTALAALVFREHLGRRVLSGSVLVVTGGLVLGWSGSPELRAGSLLLVGACAMWSLDNCLTATLDRITPEQVTLAKGLVAGTANLLIGHAIGGALPNGHVLVGTLLVGAVGYGASTTLWVAGARDLGAARGQMVFATAPFIGVAVAWLGYGDTIRWSEAVSLLFAIVGVGTVIGSSHAHAHQHDEVSHTHEHDHDDLHHGNHHHLGDPAVPAPTRHAHAHTHPRLVHAHAHLPDLHHRHDHDPPPTIT